MLRVLAGDFCEALARLRAGQLNGAAVLLMET